MQTLCTRHAGQQATSASQAPSYLINFVVPIASVVGGTLVMVLALFFWMVTIQDGMAKHRQERLVETAIAAKTKLIRGTLLDHSLWDETVRYMVWQRDLGWADDNLGPYLFKLHHFEHCFILDGQDRTIYVNDGAQRADIDAKSYLGRGVWDALAGLRANGDEAPRTGLALVGGKAAIFAVAPILPDPGAIALPPGPKSHMVLIKLLEPALLGEIGKQIDVEGLALAVPEEEMAGPRVNLRNSAGKLIGRLTWSADKPGSRMLSNTLPLILLLGVAACLTTRSVLRRVRRTADDLQSSEANAQHLADHDVLTGLPNRRHLSKLCAKVEETDEPIAIVFIDIDAFKDVNDLFGHAAGDDMLQMIAARLLTLRDEVDTLIRVGGDQFMLLLRGLKAHQRAETLAQRCLQSFESPFRSSDMNLAVSASIGVALSCAGIDSEEVHRRADVAMYAAKDEGKNRWRLYDKAMDDGRDNRKALESDLRRAIHGDEISIVFQPIVSAVDGRIVCVETLARWRHPEHGMVPPDRFIPILEESGLIVPFGKRILRDACLQSRDWEEVSVAVNLSPAQFWDKSLVADIEAILAETGFPAERLELEITEAYLTRRPDLAAAMLSEIGRLGIRISLDDFGSGFASLGSLQHFKLDKIKLDRSLVNDICTSERSAGLLHAVLALGRALNLPTTAEGVETAEQAVLLRVAGCTHMQGWLYGRPVPAAELESRFLRPAPAEMTRTAAG